MDKIRWRFRKPVGKCDSKLGFIILGNKIANDRTYLLMYSIFWRMLLRILLNLVQTRQKNFYYPIVHLVSFSIPVWECKREAKLAFYFIYTAISVRFQIADMLTVTMHCQSNTKHSSGTLTCRSGSIKVYRAVNKLLFPISPLGPRLQIYNIIII